MFHELVACMLSIETDYLSDKSRIKKHIYDVEVEQCGKATCLLYNSMDDVLATESIRINCWWSFAKATPLDSNKASSLMTVMMGGQPGGYQQSQNFNRDVCSLYNVLIYDSAMHIIFTVTEGHNSNYASIER